MSRGLGEQRLSQQVPSAQQTHCRWAGVGRNRPGPWSIRARGCEWQEWAGQAQTRGTAVPGGPAAGRAGREGLALSPDAPRKTPPAIPSYLAKAHFFQCSKTRSTEGGRGSYDGEAAEPGTSQVAACSCSRRRPPVWPGAGPAPSPWSQAPGDGRPRTRGRGPPRTWRRPAGAPARPPARQDQWRHLTLKVPPCLPPAPHGHHCPGHGSGALRTRAHVTERTARRGARR